MIYKSSNLAGLNRERQDSIPYLFEPTDVSTESFFPMKELSETVELLQLTIIVVTTNNQRISRTHTRTVEQKPEKKQTLPRTIRESVKHTLEQ